MDEDVQLERATQQIIKILLQKPQFLENWQKNVEGELEENEWRNKGKMETSTSQCQIISSIESTASELASTIDYVVSIFELNVDPQDFFLSETEQTNRNATLLYETGLKIEKLKNLDMKTTGKDAIGQHISTSCRRVNQVLKTFGKRFQGQQSLEIREISSFSNRLCELFYTISEEIQRFSEEIDSKTERKLMQKLGRKLAESSDEFNLKVVAVVEKTKKYLEKEKKRKSIRIVRPKTAPSGGSRPILVCQKPQTIQAKRHYRFASSIQEAFRKVDTLEKRSFPNFSRKKTHVAGSIAKEIVMPKPRPTRKSISTPPPLIHTNIGISDRKTENLEKEDFDVMKSAIRMTGLVIEDMKQTMRIGNNEHIVLGVGK